MKTLNFLCVLGLLASFAYSETNLKQVKDDDLQKMVLLSAVKTLAIEIPKLDGSLARALANAEVADAAWTLDRDWAKSLLKDGYQLTYLTEEELLKVSDLFKKLAAKDEIRARSAAESFKDRLRRIVALAAIYQWKAKDLEKRSAKRLSL